MSHIPQSPLSFADSNSVTQNGASLQSTLKRTSLAVALLPAGCGSMGLHPLSQAELASKTAADRAAAQQDVDPYISTDREHDSYELGLTWNLLDFGVSYIAAKQQADRVPIASERRRKAMHALV